MPSRNTYREMADACLKATETMRDPAERLAMLQMAQGYLKLASRSRARGEQGTAHHKQGEPHPENREAERFGSALRRVLGRANDRET